MSEYIKSFYSIVGIEEEPERPKTALEGILIIIIIY